MDDARPAHATPTPWRADLQQAGGRVAAGLLAGLACGTLIGGVLGRLAMLVLRLTSGAQARGVLTADNFVIGRFSRSTLFLLVLTAVLGAVGGLLYLLARTWLPTWLRPWAVAALGATVGGSVMLEPDRPDLAAVEPHWLVVVLFLALPAVYGACLSIAAERLLDRSSRPGEPGGWGWVLPLALLALCGPPGILLLLVLACAWAIDRRLPAAGRLWRSSATRWMGRGALLVVALPASADLAGNVKVLLA